MAQIPGFASFSPSDFNAVTLAMERTLQNAERRMESALNRAHQSQMQVASERATAKRQMKGLQVEAAARGLEVRGTQGLNLPFLGEVGGSFSVGPVGGSGIADIEQAIAGLDSITGGGTGSAATRFGMTPEGFRVAVEAGVTAQRRQGGAVNILELDELFSRRVEVERASAETQEAKDRARTLAQQKAEGAALSPADEDDPTGPRAIDQAVDSTIGAISARTSGKATSFEDALSKDEIGSISDSVEIILKGEKTPEGKAGTLDAIRGRLQDAIKTRLSTSGEFRIDGEGNIHPAPADALDVGATSQTDFPPGFEEVIPKLVARENAKRKRLAAELTELVELLKIDLSDVEIQLPSVRLDEPGRK